MITIRPHENDRWWQTVISLYVTACCIPNRLPPPLHHQYPTRLRSEWYLLVWPDYAIAGSNKRMFKKCLLGFSFVFWRHPTKLFLVVQISFHKTVAFKYFAVPYFGLFSAVTDNLPLRTRNLWNVFLWNQTVNIVKRGIKYLLFHKVEGWRCQKERLWDYVLRSHPVKLDFF